jgi:hypothetical protein
VGANIDGPSEVVPGDLDRKAGREDHGGDDGQQDSPAKSCHQQTHECAQRHIRRSDSQDKAWNVRYWLAAREESDDSEHQADDDQRRE